MTDDQKRFLSAPQALVQACQANTTVAILPRGGGKSSNIAPWWFTHRVKLMQRASSAIIGSTYKQLLSRTLPPFLSTLRRIGYAEGVDYVIGKRAPDFWEAEPFVKPEKYEDTILWSNGHCTYLVSQDRAGSPNSLSVLFHHIDEARYLNKERYDDDAAPTLRAGDEEKKLFEHLPEFLSTLYTTDQPTTAGSRWIYDYEDYHSDKKVEVAVNLYCWMHETLNEMQSEGVSHTRKEELRRSYNNLKLMYDDVRRDMTLFIEGSLADTVQILGTDAVRKMRRTMKPHRFDVSIMGKRATTIIGTFYPDLDDDVHTYPEKPNYTYLDSLNKTEWDEADCRQDGDINPKLPLRIGSDHGSSYNGFTIGQYDGSVLKFINNMWVLNPETTKNLVKNFHDYYKPLQKHGTEIIFYYDHTHKGESGKADNITFVDEVVDTLRELGWTVRVIYLGHTPSPNDRFNLWANCLSGKAGFPRIKMNAQKTDTLRQSMRDTMAIPGTKPNTIRKDKKPERDKSISQELTTHGGDATDILLWGVANPNDTQQEETIGLTPMVSSR
jgi:hypothetical protein